MQAHTLPPLTSIAFQTYRSVPELCTCLLLQPWKLQLHTKYGKRKKWIEYGSSQVTFRQLTVAGTIQNNFFVNKFQKLFSILTVHVGETWILERIDFKQRHWVMLLTEDVQKICMKKYSLVTVILFYFLRAEYLDSSEKTYPFVSFTYSSTVSPTRSECCASSSWNCTAMAGPTRREAT